MHKIFFTTLLSIALPIAAQAGHHGGEKYEKKYMKHHAEISETHEGEGHDMENMSVAKIEKAMDTCMTKCTSKKGMSEESCNEKHGSHIEKMRERIKKLQSSEHHEMKKHENEHNEDGEGAHEGYDD